MKPRLPLTVISGYLGAGKTTLLNRLLAEDHGLRVLVMVNDFGAINIDATLLASASEDTLVLSNGCVCCTMGADLFMAIGDVLDRPDRPDHLVIEASGVADPARIAQAAQAEPELAYGGIITVVDASAYGMLSKDPQIGAQVARQVAAADLLCLSKTDGSATAFPTASLNVRSRAPVVDLAALPALAPVLFGAIPASSAKPGNYAATGTHEAYVSWHHSGGEGMTREALAAKLAVRPDGMFRFKGHVAHDAQSAWEAHCVGPEVSIKAVHPARATQIVGIGLKSRVTRAQMSAWWAR